MDYATNLNFYEADKYVFNETSCDYDEFPKYEPIVRHRNQANARERDRTQNVNSAFATLRSLIPTEPRDRKLSKIEILRLAGSYISHLANRLMTGHEDQPCMQSHELSEERARNQVCTFCWSHKKEI